MGERLAGKVAIVTGAGQSPGQQIGNGRATALLFAREGASVVLVDREREAAESTAAAIAEESGTAVVVAADVSVEEDCVAAVAAALERFGGLDVVHHNVGIGTGDGWAENIELEAWERIMRVNAGGAVLMAKAARARDERARSRRDHHRVLDRLGGGKRGADGKPAARLQDVQGRAQRADALAGPGLRT